MHRERFYLSDALPGRGRRPPQLVTLHSEGDRLVVAISPTPGRRALRAPPSRTMLWDIRRVVAPEVGECRFGEWQPFHESSGELAGWMASIDAPRAAIVAAKLESA